MVKIASEVLEFIGGRKEFWTVQGEEKASTTATITTTASIAAATAEEEVSKKKRVKNQSLAKSKRTKKHSKENGR